MSFHGWRLLHLLIAYILALPAGWERERDEESAGLRTFPLMALASCAFVSLGLDYLGPGDPTSRLMQGLISGLGLLSAGAIIQDRQRVHGTATAASLFAMAAVGSAVAFGAFDIAIAISLITFGTLRLLKPFTRAEGGRGPNGPRR